MVRLRCLFLQVFAFVRTNPSGAQPTSAPPPAMMILICQVNKVEAKKGGGGEYHAGKIVKYQGWRDFDIKNTYLVQFEDNTEENVNGSPYGGCIKVGSQ